ncbi:MAG TPA: hypothetical protein VHN74_06095 [Candidatus Angelobacter sp.]|nr:hypothetical protein [Candidatus Angelobacter sp.]
MANPLPLRSLRYNGFAVAVPITAIPAITRDSGVPGNPDLDCWGGIPAI